MTYLEFIESVELYLRQQNNTQIRAIIKSLIPEVILEFVRYNEWLNTQTIFEFTTGKSALPITQINSVNKQRL